MNITKRMLRFGAAAVAVAIGSNALAVGLGLPVQEGFEDYDEGDSATNLTDWASTSVDDASIITNMTYTFDPVTEGITYPLGGITPAIAHQKVLKLNTEGGTLAASLDTTETVFSSQNIYVDTMVNMVISEDDPSFTGVTDVKVAVFANASSNLVIRHGMIEGETFYLTNTVTDVVVDPANWYRLTIVMDTLQVTELLTDYAAFQVYLDGVLIDHDNTYAATWFLSGSDRGELDWEYLNAIAFQGTGFIDDLVVTTADPFAPVGVTYVYVIEEYVDGVGPTYIDIDEDGWSKGYTPSDSWSKIGLDTGSEEIFEVSGSTVSTGSATEEQLRGTNRVEVLTDVAKTAADLGGQYSGLTEDQIAWLSGLGYPSSTAFDSDGHSLEFEEAMKLDPYANETVTAEITEFVVGDPDSTITVKVLVDAVAYAESGLTVKIVVDTKENLSDGWTTDAFTENVSSFDINGEASITFATPAANFFRARIVEQ